MYLVNTELTVNWILRATAYDIPLLADLDISINPPKGISNTEYTDNAILAENYTAPTLTTDGYVTYRFTPNVEGLWEITLSNGTSTNNMIYHTYKLLISSNDTYTKFKVPGNLI